MVRSPERHRPRPVQLLLRIGALALLLPGQIALGMLLFHALQFTQAGLGGVDVATCTGTAAVAEYSRKG